MSIQIGEKIPSVTVKRLGQQGMEDFNLAENIAGKKVIVFAVPGAFTPSCDQKHLPGYIMAAADLKAKGIDEIFCIAVNDPFVMHKWGEISGANGKVTMVPDGNVELTRAMGMEFDGAGAGLNVRSKRYNLIVEDGVITDMQVENSPADVNLSDAQTCLAKL